MTRRPHLSRCSLAVPVGMRLLVVSESHQSASSLLRVLGGLSRPRRGRVEIAGLTEGWERRVAYLGPEPGLHAWMTPREVLELAASLLGIHGDEAARRFERAMAWVRVGAEEFERPMSRGGSPLLQRVGLAAALIGDPEVLLLDEPLRALDEAERARILTLPASRRTVLVASRYPASDADLASHVVLIQGGRVTMVASMNDLADAGLPLSLSGIVALADRRVTDSPRRAGPAAATL